MKKFAKVCLMITLIIMFVGIALYLVGYAGGGRQDIAKMEEAGELDFSHGYFHFSISSLWNDGDFGFFYIGDDESLELPELVEVPEHPDAPDAPDVPDAPDAPDAPKPPLTGENNEGSEKSSYAGTMNMTLSAENVKNLDIELGGGELIVCPLSPEEGEKIGKDKILIESESKDDYRCYVKDNTLYIRGFDLKKEFWNWISGYNKGDNVLYIRIPESLAFAESEIELGAGTINITDVTLGDTDVEIGAGSAEFCRINTSVLSVEVGAGAAYVKQAVIEKAEFLVSAGEAVIDGEIKGDCNLECSMGSIEAKLKGKETDFNYDVEASMGSVSIGNSSYDGIASARNIDNGAKKAMSIETSMGDVTVTFSE